MKTLITVLAIISIFLVWHPRGKMAAVAFFYSYWLGLKHFFCDMFRYITNEPPIVKEFPLWYKLIYYTTLTVCIFFICFLRGTQGAILSAVKILKGDFINV